MSTASGERRLRLAASRQALYSIPLNELFELPGRPHVVWQLRSYADSANAAEAAQLARAEIPFLFKAFETGQIGPKRMAKMHGGKPRMSTIHEYLDWTVTAQAAQEDDELDFGGFRVLLLLPRYVPTWPYPDNPSTSEGKRAHPVLGPSLPPLPFLQAHGRALSAATIRSGPGYLEIPFVATHEGKRGKGYCRCLLEAIEDISRALGLKKLMLCSTNDPIVKSTWHHLGFDFTTEEQMHEWDTPHSDLVYLQNTTQMHKEVPVAGQYKSVKIRHGLFQQRMYARLDQVPKRPKLHQPPPKKAPPKKAPSQYAHYGINNLSLQSSMSLNLSRMTLPAPSTCTSYMTANTTSGLEDGAASTPEQTGMEVDQQLGAPVKGHDLTGAFVGGGPAGVGTQPQHALPQSHSQPQHVQPQPMGQNEAQSALHTPNNSFPLTMPVLALGDGPPAATLPSIITHGPSQGHSPVHGGSPLAAGSAGTAHMGALTRLRNSPLPNSPLRVVAGPSNLGLDSHHSGPVHFGAPGPHLPLPGSHSSIPGMVPSTLPISNGSSMHTHNGIAAAGLTMDAHLSAVSAASAAQLTAAPGGVGGSLGSELLAHDPVAAHAAAAASAAHAAAGLSAGASPAAASAVDPQHAYLEHMKQLQRQQMHMLQMKASQQQPHTGQQLQLPAQQVAGLSPGGTGALVSRNSLDLASPAVPPTGLLPHQPLNPFPGHHHQHQHITVTSSSMSPAALPHAAMQPAGMSAAAAAASPHVAMYSGQPAGVSGAAAAALPHTAMHAGQPAAGSDVMAAGAAGAGGLVTRLSDGHLQPTLPLGMATPATAVGISMLPSAPATGTGLLSTATATGMLPTTTGAGLLPTAAATAGTGMTPTATPAGMMPVASAGNSMIPTASASMGMVQTAIAGTGMAPTGVNMIPTAATAGMIPLTGVSTGLNQPAALPLGLDGNSLLGATSGLGQLSAMTGVGQMHAAAPAAQPVQQVWGQQ